MRTTTKIRSKLALLFIALAVMIAVPAVAALADTVSNNLDNSVDSIAESTSVNAGSTTQVGFKVNPANSDGVPGCNVKNDGTLVANVVSDNPSVATADATITFENCTDVKYVTVTGVSAGTANFTLTENDNNTNGTFSFAEAEFKVTVNASAKANTSVSNVSGSGTYGGDATLKANLAKSSDSSALSGKTVEFKLNGQSVGSDTTDSTGLAELSGVSLSGINAGGPTGTGYENAVSAAFSGDSSHNGSSATGNLTVDERPITVTADAKNKTYGDADPNLTSQITSGSLVGTDAFTGTLSRVAGENVGTYAIEQGTLALSSNYELTYVGANLTIDPRPIAVTADDKTKVLGASDPSLTYQITSGNLVGSDAFSGSLTRDPGETIGSYAIKQGTLALSSNYSLAFSPGTLKIQYAAAGANCFGSPGHEILQPINKSTGLDSTFKLGSTVPAKFRVCDANGNSIGTPGVVTSFKLVKTISGTESSTVNEEVISTTPDTAFRWDATNQQWIFNINTKKLSAGKTYVYQIALNDGSVIEFQFGIR